MAEKKKYNSILISGRKDETLTYSRYIKDEESGESVKETLDKKVNVSDKLETQQIKNGAITNEKLSADSVGNGNIQDGSVSNEKLENGSVTNEKLAVNSITKDKLKDNTIGVEKLDPELRQTIEAATGLTGDLVKTIQNVDETLRDHQNQLNDKQSQLDDKQRQITANDEDISLLQTRSTQMEETIKGIAATGGASQATAVTYNNEKSGLDAVNIQAAIDEIISNLGHYETNEEWLRAYTDSEGKFLWGIRVDGSIDWSVGIPTPIRAKLQEIVRKCQQDKIDLTEAINSAKEELTASITSLQESKVDKEEGKSLIEDEVRKCFKVIENEEFLKAIVDSEDRVLFGIYRATGKPYYPLNDMYHISHSEEFLWVILDAANHPLLGIKEDGTCWASKAQWLDDIKAIKEVLSSIDETLKTFQPKEDGKGLINMEIADSFFYISNDEYIIAVVDAEDRILVGIKYDGEPYFPNHEMYSIITNEEWLYAIIDAEEKVLGGFRADDGHMIVGSIDISNFIANAIIEVADIKKRIAHLLTIENDEYLSIETDADGKVLGYTAPDGSHYLYKVKSETIDAKVDKEEGRSLIDADVANAHSTLEDPEGRMEIVEDADGKVMSYRDADGKKHEHDIEVTNLNVSNLNLKGNSVNDIQNALIANGFDTKHPVDWSNSDFIQIPEPRFAIINITNIDSMPTSKTQNKKAFFEFWDMQGNYFKKHAILNAQGRSSMGFPKKNVAIDFCDDEWIGDETPKIRIGSWVPQDSFHLKANYIDLFRGVGCVSYGLYEDIVKTRGNMYDRPWKKALLDMPKIGVTTKSIGNQYVGNYDLLTDTGARCFPDGFPLACYLNGEFYGVFSWQLKKHRDNYHMDKSTAEHVHLDGIVNKKYFWGDSIDWSQFEVRNPKNLYAIGGNKYDADVKQEEIAGETEVNAWIEAGELPDGTKISSKVKKNLQTTAKVKKYILNFSQFLQEIKSAEETYNTSNKSETDLNTFKSVFEKYWDVDNVIDYIIVSTLIDNWDGVWGNNWQLFTYDGKKWWIGLYDVDCTFGNYYTGDRCMSPMSSYCSVSKDFPFGYITSYYTEELNARYKELADCGIINYRNIFERLHDWTMRIGTDFYKEEYRKWDDSPCISDSEVRSDFWEIMFDAHNNPETSNTETFDATKSYAVGDEVSFGIDSNMGFFKFRCVKETTGLSTNVPHEISAFSPIRKFKHCDSLYRVEKWVCKDIINMDKIFNYTRNN